MSRIKQIVSVPCRYARRRCGQLPVLLAIAIMWFSAARAAGDVSLSREIDPITFWPLDSGNSWTFENEFLPAADADSPSVRFSWRSKVQVRQRLVTPQGVFVRVGIDHGGCSWHRPGDVAADCGALQRRLAVDTAQGFWLRGDTLFSVPPGWVERKLRSPDKTDLPAADSCRPQLVFPLVTGRPWSRSVRQDGVVGPGPWCIDSVEDVVVANDTFPDAFRRIHRDGLGQDTTWFCDEVGVVKRSVRSDAGNLRSRLSSFLLLPAMGDTVLLFLIAEDRCLSPTGQIELTLKAQNIGRDTMGLAVAADGRLQLADEPLCQWEIRNLGSSPFPVSKPAFAGDNTSPGMAPSVQCVAPGASCVVARRKFSATELFGSNNGVYEIRCIYSARSLPASGGCRPTHLVLKSNSVRLRVGADCGPARQPTASAAAAAASMPQPAAGYSTGSGYRYGPPGGTARYSSGGGNFISATQSYGGNFSSAASPGYTAPSPDTNRGYAPSVAPGTTGAAPAPRSLSREQAQQIARDVCTQQGWPWIDPLVMDEEESSWLVLTNSKQRFNNARIRISTVDGRVIEISGPNGKSAMQTGGH